MFERKVLPNGLQVEKWRTSLGVIGVIYESRPNVTVDAASLSIKTGNAIILRGGSETLNTNRVLVEMIRKALKSASLPENAVQWIDSSDRGLVKQLLHLHDFIDLIIPRGGARLHQFCRENSTIPVITGGIGICHLFVDKSADLEAALPLIYNAKVQHPTACNALDTLLVHREIANEFLPRVSKTLEAAGVVLRTDGEAWKILHGEHLVEKAREESDWDTEWLSLNLGIKIVKGLKEAVEHIQKHSRGHSDGILTQDPEQAKKFVQQVDSAAVYVNASTRFTDGGQLGLGAEIAISTQKFHARGPMGLNELTSYKWVIQGNYHVRQ
jgi:glutamate-5-semialdehyde dehydrogenase